MAETTFSKKDRVIVLDFKGEPVCPGTIVNINEFREPAVRYAVALDRYTDDLVFVSKEQLKKENK